MGLAFMNSSLRKIALARRLKTVAEAADWLSDGNLLIYPTETFFALGCTVDNSEGMNAIYTLKLRERNKPLPVLGASIACLEKIVQLNFVVKRLGEVFWPGPLSILCPALSTAPSHLQNARGEISVRITSCANAAFLCEKLGKPLVATSANLSGEPPALKPEELAPTFMEKAAASKTGVGIILWPGENGLRLPSTIISLTMEGKIRLLREGRISAQRIARAGFEVETGEA